MEECTQCQKDAEALKTFRQHIHEMTDNGRLLTEFYANAMVDDAYRFLGGPWSYMRAVHSSMENYTLATDGHDLYDSYKNWCETNLLNPVWPDQLYNAVFETFRAESRKTNGRRVLRGLQLVSSDDESSQIRAA